MDTWAKHVRDFSKTNSISLKDAMKHPSCKDSWMKKKTSTMPLPVKPPSK